MLEQQKNEQVDSQQYYRQIQLNEALNLLDEITDEDPEQIEEVFESLEICTKAYLERDKEITHTTVINIIRDIRTFTNSQGDQSLFYLTDVICDKILLAFKGMPLEYFENFSEFLGTCRTKYLSQ